MPNRSASLCQQGRHSCDAEIRAIPDGWATSGWRQEGEQWTCSCGATFTHICDEAEGCFWAPEEVPGG